MKKYAIPAVAGIAIILAASLALSSPKKDPALNSSEPSSSQSGKTTAKNTVLMLADGFRPLNLSVKKGQKVTFINQDSEDHWPASNPHPTHQIYAEFDPKKPINSGSSWQFTFDKVGTWGYHDHLYPGLQATITVTP